MDVIQGLIWSLNEDGQKQFKKYLRYRSNKIDRKDLIVFTQLCETRKIDSKKIVQKLYGNYSETNARAYHVVRVRLKEQLENFFMQKTANKDNQMLISRLTKISRDLYFQKEYQLAWHYLEEAELVALKAEEYELLNQVYQHMIEYAWTQPFNVLRELIVKERENQKQAQITRSLNLAFSVIQSQLIEDHLSGRKSDIEKISREALNEFEVQGIISQKASHRFKLAMLVMLKLEEKNEYETLAQYLIQTLKEMDDADLFDKYNYRYKIELLNTICSALLRAGDYKKLEQYLIIIDTENSSHPEFFLLCLKSFIAKCVLFAYTNRLQEAIDLLEYLKKKYNIFYKQDDYFFLVVNKNSIAIALELNQINIARKYINILLKSPIRIIRQDGIDSLFYCNTIECILAIEANDLEYADYRIQSLKRKFKKLLNHEDGKRNLSFIKLLQKACKGNNIWEEKDFKEEALQFIKLNIIYYPSFKEFISFNAWVYSKLEKVPYNEAKYNVTIREKLKIVNE